jgi:mRNA interferase HicA
MGCLRAAFFMSRRIRTNPGSPWMGRLPNKFVGPAAVNRYVDPMTSAEFKRWLEKQGATFSPGKGGHLKISLNGLSAVLPMHGSRHELKKGTVEAIKKQLGLKQES